MDREDWIAIAVTLVLLTIVIATEAMKMRGN